MSRYMTRLAVLEPYDMDTGIGTNNSGVLMFSPFLEDTDTVSSVISGSGGGSNAPVFNAQDSVLWNNVRDAFRSEIIAMYRSLRSSGKFSYEYIENLFEEHQSKWPEALVNEDAKTKYLIPLIMPVTVDENTGKLIKTDRYLTMLQGLKTEQRKWWLFNRFKYLDSKYITGTAATNIISIRLFNSGTLNLKSAIPLYLNVAFGGGTTPSQKRVDANEVASFVYTAPSGVTEMETWIYSGDLITDVGDLSVFYPNEVDFSKATRLTHLKIGDSASSYSNANLRTFDVRNSILLETLDVRNCPRLNITPNLENLTRLREAYFEGTTITGIEIADGGVIEVLHLPSTLTALTLLNLNRLRDFEIASYSNISRLMLANIDANVIDPITVLKAIQPKSQVNIQGLYLEAADAAKIEEVLDLFDTMQGVTRERGADGEWLYYDFDTAQISGTIHTSALTGAQIASYNSRYPYIRVVADHTSTQLKYRTYDDSADIDVETIIDGGDGTKVNTTQRVSDAQYTYSPDGWALTPGGNKNENALKNVVADRTVYAAYSKTLRSYTVTFVRSTTDGGGTLETKTLQYGSQATYTGATPTTTQGSAEDYPFEGWTPSLGPVTGNITYTAKFGSPVDDTEISDSWDTIIANIDNGTYKTKYKVGNYKPLDLGTEGTVNMQIVGFDVDELGSGGMSPITFIAKELLATTHNMNSTDTTSGGWESSAIRAYLTSTILPLVPNNVRSRLQPVKKYSSTYDSAIVKDGQTTIDRLWIPGHKEIFNASTYETQGPSYSTVYKDTSSRIKTRPGSAYGWWLRSASTATNFRRVHTTGYATTSSAYDTYGVALGFALGGESETITDSWEQIKAAEADGSYLTKYSIGDTKAVNFGSEGTHLMEIVAFDADDLADDSGKAHITWIMKDLLPTTHRMNPSRTANTSGTGTLGGWENSEMRDYIRTTIRALMPTEVLNAIVEVKKVSNAFAADTETKFQQTTVDDLWIPGHKEIFNSTTYDTSGPSYSDKFTDATSRIKKRNGSADVWWLRSASTATNFRRVNLTGVDNSNSAYYTYGVALGFDT